MSAAERHELEPHATKIAAAARRYLMRNMVANFVDANKTDNEGRGVLHQYACDGLCYAGTLALIRGTDVNLRDKNMQTALHQAAYNSHPHFVCLLLGQLGVEIDDRDVSGWTPLHWSCYVGKADVTVESGTDDAKAVRLANLNAGLRRLKDQGDELNQTRDERRTAVAQALCEAGAAVNAKLWKGWGVGNGSTPLHMAATFGCVSAAQVLIQHGADVTILDDLGYTPLFVAVRENQVEMVRVLVHFYPPELIAALLEPREERSSISLEESSRKTRARNKRMRAFITDKPPSGLLQRISSGNQRPWLPLEPDVPKLGYDDDVEPPAFVEKLEWAERVDLCKLGLCAWPDVPPERTAPLALSLAYVLRHCPRGVTAFLDKLQTRLWSTRGGKAAWLHVYAPLEPPPSVLQLDPSLRVVRQAVSSHLKSVVVHPVVQGLCDLKWRKYVSHAFRERVLFDLAFAVVCSAVLMSGSLTVSADEADTAPHDDGAAEAPFGWHEERERSHGRQLWASGLVLRFWDPSGRPPSAPPSPGAVDLGDFRQVPWWKVLTNDERQVVEDRWQIFLRFSLDETLAAIFGVNWRLGVLWVVVLLRLGSHVERLRRLGLTRRKVCGVRMWAPRIYTTALFANWNRFRAINLLATLSTATFFTLPFFGMALPEQHEHTSHRLAAISAMMPWGLMLQHASTVLITGPYVVMLEKMVEDISIFMTVFFVFYSMYTIGMVVLLQPFGAAAGPYATVSGASTEAFLLLVDNNEMEFQDLAAVSSVGAVAFCTYAFLVVVMLLNVLIAMMGATFARVSDDAHREYLMARARLICYIDEEYDPAEAAEHWQASEQVVRADEKPALVDDVLEDE